MVQENYPLSNRLKLEEGGVLLLRGTDYQKLASSSPKGIFSRLKHGSAWIYM
jgi:hypothetical protein